MPFTVVIAPDSFKGSLPAREVAAAVASGWRAVRPDDLLLLEPQADGGEGTLDAVECAVSGALRHHLDHVTGPDGRPTVGAWLELPDGTAVVELAQCCGLPLMLHPDAMGATTRGLGEVIRAALENGATSLVIGLGGSASTDGGAGALTALGLKLIDEQGDYVRDGGRGLTCIVNVDRTNLLAAPAGGVTLLTDVDAPLLGTTGAAEVFGPQKGADTPEVQRLDAALAHFADLMGGDRTTPGAGAAGGAGFGFAAAWGARIAPGADYIAALTNLDARLAQADLLITGEGRFDEQSRGGKIVGQLLHRAAAARVTTAVIAGQIAAPTGGWETSLTELAGSVDAAMAEPARWLHEAGAQAARELGG